MKTKVDIDGVLPTEEFFVGGDDGGVFLRISATQIRHRYVCRIRWDSGEAADCGIYVREWDRRANEQPTLLGAAEFLAWDGNHIWLGDGSCLKRVDDADPGT